MKTEQLRNELESLIDSNSLSTVLDAISVICHEKAEHVNENWQDKTLAKSWVKAGNRIGRMLVDCILP
jgi:hypothetical protein